MDVYLPDELWNRLHPVKTSDRWMVRYRGSARAKPAAREDDSGLFTTVDDEFDSDPDVEALEQEEPDATGAGEGAERGGASALKWLLWLLLAGTGAFALVYLLLHWHV